MMFRSQANAKASIEYQWAEGLKKELSTILTELAKGAKAIDWPDSLSNAVSHLENCIDEIGNRMDELDEQM